MKPGSPVTAYLDDSINMENIFRGVWAPRGIGLRTKQLSYQLRDIQPLADEVMFCMPSFSPATSVRMWMNKRKVSANETW